MVFRRKIVGVFLLAGLFLAMLASPAAYSRHVGLFEFLTQTVRLCDDDMKALKDGTAVVMEIPSSPKNELFLFGAVRVDTPLDAYLADQRNPLFFEREMVQTWGQFSDPPGEEDLRDLTWPEEDLEALPQCRPGNCKIKLPPGYLDQLQPYPGDQTLFADRANALLRRTLIDYVDNYRRRGNAALMDYRDKQRPVSIAEEFAGILENFSSLNVHPPDLEAYLKDYPKNRPSETQNRFIWAKVHLGGKAKRPVIFIYHLVTYKLPGGRDTLVALKQIYASHYFEAALALTLLLPDPENGSRFYLVHFDRGRIDMLRHIPAFLSGAFKGETCLVLTRRLQEIREHIQQID
jgi:hypothetical protein